MKRKSVLAVVFMCLCVPLAHGGNDWVDWSTGTTQPFADSSGDLGTVGLTGDTSRIHVEYDNVDGSFEVLDFGIAGGGSTCVPAPPGLVGWWPLDEPAGPTAHDIGPQGHDGTHIDGPLPTPAGKVDGALTFSGPTDGNPSGDPFFLSARVEISHHPDFNVGLDQDFSIDAWIRTSDSGLDGGHIISKMDPGPTDIAFGWEFRLTNQCELAFGMSWNDGFPGSLTVAGGTYPNVNLCDGEWHFVAVTVARSPNGGRLYVDALPAVSWDPTTLTSSPDTTGPVHIGAGGITLIGFPTGFNGTIDEVEFYHRALSASDVSSIFLADSAGKCKPCAQCGDGVCEGDETICNCPADCGAGGGSDECGGFCLQYLPTCGNNDCESCAAPGESHENCPQDCPLDCQEAPQLPVASREVLNITALLLLTGLTVVLLWRRRSSAHSR